MGAVPSRESLQRGLYPIPNYGQRQQIILIPLTKAFFPSADSPLMKQFCEVRNDPFVRYYHCYGEGISHEPTLDSGNNSNNTKREDDGCGAHAWCAETFPSATFTPAALYEAYVCRAGESRLFDTDQTMFTAYTENPQQLWPIPCAVAFAYLPSCISNTTEVPVLGCGNNTSYDNNDGGVKHVLAGDDGEEDGRSVGAAEANNYTSSMHSTMHKGSLVEGSVDVCGWRVHVVGFFGDVSALHRVSPTTTTTTISGNSENSNASAMRLQMFMSKSVGDHNCMHVLYAALYTYVIQWRHAAVNTVRRRASPSETHMLEENFQQPLLDTIAAHETKDDNGNENAWPPLCDVITTCRRTNVPMLCFQRSIRAMFVGMDLISRDVSNALFTQMEDNAAYSDANNTTPHGQRAVPKNSPLEIPHSDRSEVEKRVYHTIAEGALEEKFMTMWLEDDILFAQIPEEVARCAVHYVVDCISHNEHPLGVLQTKLSQGSHLTGLYELGIRQSLFSEVPGGSSAEATSTTTTTTTTTTITPTTTTTTATSTTPVVGLTGNDTVNERAFKVVKGTCTVRIAIPQFPDELVVVEPWPEEGISVLALKAFSCKHVNTHLYWVVGTSEAAQRTAAATFAEWKSHEMSVEASNTYTNTLVNTTDSVAPMMRMSVGESLHLVAFSSKTEEENQGQAPSLATHLQHELTNFEKKEDKEQQQQQQQQAGILKRGRFPLEELLLAELRNTSKQAREADVHSPNWVRCSDAMGAHAAAHLHAPPSGKTERCEAQDFMAAVAQLVGDGLLCLWRVLLPTGVMRVIAVTPKFVRPVRKRRLRRRPTHQRTLKNNSNNSNKTLITTMDKITGNQELCLNTQHAVQELREIPSPPALHHQDFFTRLKDDVTQPTFSGVAFGLNVKTKNAVGSGSFGDNLFEQATHDPVVGGYHRRSATQVSCVSSSVSSHPPPWDANVNFWPTVTNDQAYFLPRTHHRPRHKMTLSSPKFLRTYSYDNTTYNRNSGVFCLREQSPRSNFEGGNMFQANGGFTDFNAFLVSSRSGTPSEHDRYANAAINVTVHHGMPHYRTQSSLTFSDTTSNNDSATARGHITNTTGP